ncbi:Membrane fusion protein (MFP) family protein [Sphingomonas antarctica]|uniref:HlyD family type I secretion periplasmic adaptor subunit n=1 Tax=Sphingomonas antarctica TaxID=2040274 RepID=UPI0039EC8BE2
MNAISGHWQIARDALAAEKARAKGLVRTEETAFLPAALEITERPVSPTARATAWLLLTGLLLTTLWLVFGKVDIVVSASGKLIPADNVKLVQPAEAGIVRAIYVRDGQHVRKGQPLIALDPTVAGAETEQSRKALETAELDAARARAVLGALEGHGLAFVPPAGTPTETAATQRQLAQAELAGIEASMAGMGADTRTAAAARGEARIQAAKLGETLPLLDEQIAANETLLAKGYVSKLKVIEMRRQRLAAARDHNIALQTVRTADAQLASTGTGGARTRAETRAKVLADLAKAESDASLRREELVKAKQRSGLQQLLSPADGVVTGFAAHTIGGIVEAAKPIMIVVPAGSSLVMEGNLPNRDRAFVRVGQDVVVKLEAYPFTRFGTVIGTVEAVGSDAVETEKLGLVYPVRVRLHRAPSGMDLSVGMSATADIQAGRRSIISYLISPIEHARATAGRER